MSRKSLALSVLCMFHLPETLQEVVEEAGEEADLPEQKEM
jgi:hypothetical protein